MRTSRRRERSIGRSRSRTSTLSFPMPWFALALANPSYPLSKVSYGRVHWLRRLRLPAPVRATLAGSLVSSASACCVTRQDIMYACNGQRHTRGFHPRQRPGFERAFCTVRAWNFRVQSPISFIERAREGERSLVPLAGCTTSGSCLRWPCMTCRIILEEGKAVFARPQRDLLPSRRHQVRKSNRWPRRKVTDIMEMTHVFLFFLFSPTRFCLALVSSSTSQIAGSRC
jgi:hypothetical protein